MIEATSPTDALTGETEAGRCNGWDRAAGGDRAHRELPGGTAPPAPACGHLPKGQIILILRVASLGAGPAAIPQIPPCPQHPGARTAALPDPPGALTLPRQPPAPRPAGTCLRGILIGISALAAGASPGPHLLPTPCRSAQRS